MSSIVQVGQEWKLGVKDGIEIVLGTEAIAMDMQANAPDSCTLFVNEINEEQVRRLRKKIGYPIVISASSMVQGKIKFLMVMLTIKKA